MADRFYSVSLGEQLVSQVTEGSSTSGEAVELRISDSIYANKFGVLMSLKAIVQYLETRETQPVA